MKAFRFLLLTAAILMCATAAAQDFKPVKDKATKKFGYQAKDKSWVIEPSFDKAEKFKDGRAVVTVDGLEGMIDESGAWLLQPEYNKIGKFDKLGLCELTVKEGKSKFYGVANAAGQVVLPPDAQSVSISRSEALIMAKREAQDGSGSHWGVYDIEGREIFAPQFESAPSWRNGSGVARSSYNGMVGLIGNGGDVLLPFDYLAISDANSRDALAKDFSVISFDRNLHKTTEFRSPGSIIPYETAFDDVRLASWHAGCVGVRLHSNNICAANLSKDASGRIAICNRLDLNWGFDRFVRLEPEIESTPHTGSMEHPYTGDMYTLRALMYEADGRYVGVVSDWGWLEGDFNGGYIYCAEGEDYWLIMDGVNARTPRPGTSLKLRSWQNVDHTNVVSGLLLSNADLGRMKDYYYRVKRQKEILEGENVGVNSYLPRPQQDRRATRRLMDAMRNPIFQRPFMMGDVVNCKTSKRGDDIEITLSDILVGHFEDRFDSPYYRMEGEEEIYWGPNGRRSVYLNLEEAEPGEPSMEDDVNEHGTPLKVVITLHEEDGTYLRTLGEAPAPDFIEDGVIVFEGLGLALIERAPGRFSIADREPLHSFKVPAEKRLKPVLSAIKSQAPPQGKDRPQGDGRPPQGEGRPHGEGRR